MNGTDSQMSTSNNLHLDHDHIIGQFRKIRSQSERLMSSLTEADLQLQAMADVSPGKWHLAHTTWFFETFILKQQVKAYVEFNPEFNYLFNSYYNGIGEQFTRAKRGLISRPSLSEVMNYRDYVNNTLIDWLNSASPCQKTQKLIELGLQHEQQHQELFLTDLKYNFFQNPLYPEYQSLPSSAFKRVETSTALEWLPIEVGIAHIGHDIESFCFDNEKPHHRYFIEPCSIASRLVTNGEYLEFMSDGGYDKPEYWLSDGWAWRQQNNSHQPLYWVKKEGIWYEFTLFGLQPLDLDTPVSHVNYYEASAFANWSGFRLPTEFEWEAFVKQQSLNITTPSMQLHPQALSNSNDYQLFNHLWQWTSSSYNPYPGFSPFEGAAGEYNGKFMSNQYVLRGSSCVTPIDHSRVTYRNFFYAHQAWQFTGIRLAK